MYITTNTLVFMNGLTFDAKKGKKSDVVFSVARKIHILHSFNIVVLDLECLFTCMYY